MSNTVVTIGLIILGVAIGLGFGYLIARLAIARRHERDGVSAEDVVTSARLDAQRILAKAEEEGRAKAETYREREEANLEHRRLEASSLEGRLAQREETLDQRASNLAQREKMLIDREEELNDSRGQVERLKEEARVASGADGRDRRKCRQDRDAGPGRRRGAPGGDDRRTRPGDKGS